MKRLVILLLTLGIIGVIANPVSKQTIQSENKNSPQAESSESQTKHKGVINTSNKGDKEQKKDTIENSESPNIINTSKDVDEKVEIVIEENIFSTVEPLLSDEKCGDKNSNNPIEKSEKHNFDGDVNENVEIIIEENLVSPIDELQPQEGFTGVLPLPGFNEDVSLPLPAFGDSPPIIQPELIGGPQVAVELEGPQFPEFVEDMPQLPDFIGGIPQLPGFNKDGPQMLEFIEDSQTDDDKMDFIDKDYFKDDMEKIEHEIMETAAGFVPTPLVFRRKQRPRRRFPTRRHFRRNPYRRHQFFYPYRYYSFYRPSSLRFY